MAAARTPSQTAQQPAEPLSGRADSTSRASGSRARASWRWLRFRRLLDRRARLVALGLVLLLTAFSVLAIMLRQAAGTAADVAITRWVQQFDDPAFAALMRGVSAIGYWPWGDAILVAALAGCLAARWYREAAFVLATQGAGWLAASIKLLIERPRPTSDLVRVLGHVGETSYPSGHVTSYVVLYGLLFVFVFVRMRTGWRRTAMLTLFGALVGLVGVSRIYLGHHWASDVAGGYALGGAYLLLLLEAYRWLALPVTAPPAEPVPDVDHAPATASPPA